MKNSTNLWTDLYLVQFQLAQKNFNLLIKEQRLLKRIERSKRSTPRLPISHKKDIVDVEKKCMN